MSTRVLITEGAERGPLTACRSLRRAGYSVSVAADTRLAAALRSRSCDERLIVPSPKKDPNAFVSALEQILSRREYAALLPGGDASLLAVSRHGRGLEERARVGLVPPEAVERSVDKVLLLEEGTAAGMPPPESAVCRDWGEVAAAADTIAYPLVLKPPRSILDEPGGIRQQRVVLVAKPEDLLDAVAAVRVPLIVQRFERDVERLSCAGVFVGDKLTGLAVARFVRTWPANAGAASFAETVEPREDLVEGAVKLLASIGWEGIFELEVLAFPDGRLATMDLNPRLFGWLALAVRAGADLPAIWCESLLGGKPAGVVAQPGVRYRWEDAEASNLLRLARRGRVREAGELLLPRPNVAHAHFEWRDPVPLFARTAEVVARRAKNRSAQRVSTPQRRSRIVRPAKAALMRSRSTRWARRNGRPEPQEGLRILFYHRVSPERDDLAVSPRRFREQMDYLHDEGYSVLDVMTAYGLLESGGLPPRAIALSFDDGYHDVVDHALPMLSERDFSATVFVTSGAVDGTAPFAWYRRQPPLIRWEEMVDLDREGTLRFEAHSVSHPNLAVLPAPAAAEEISTSKLVLEGHLGRPVTVFSYPGGIFTAREEKLVAEAGYGLAVSCNPGLNVPGGDRFALFRQSIEPRDNLLDFRAKVSGGHDTPLPLQHLYRRLRYPTEPTL